MKAFDGFSEEIFQCCKPSEKIRKPIKALKELKFEIEPELKKINPSLIGHVSRTKKKGTNEYYDWAWLYYNTKDIEAYRYSQLTVNVSPDRLYVGINIRTYPEHEAFFNGIGKEENSNLFQQIARTLSGREWIISTSYDESWEQETPRARLIPERSPLTRLIRFGSPAHWILEYAKAMVTASKMALNMMRSMGPVYSGASPMSYMALFGETISL
jgi:hypothetical protein